MASPSDAADARFVPARADIVLPAGMAGPDPMTFDVHAFVVRRVSDVVLVDTLMLPEHVQVIEDALAEADADFTDIAAVVLTHAHPDHTGGLAEVARLAPQARVLCGAADAEAVTGSTGVRVEALAPDADVHGLLVVPSPGHTPGHLCLFDPDSSTMLLGDVVGNIGRLERGPAQFTADAEQAEESLRRLAGLEFANALPAHGDPVTGDASGALARLLSESQSN